MVDDREGIVWTDWAHSPKHLFIPDAFYIVTGGTYHKERLFNTPARLSMLRSSLFEEAERFQWELQAWAVLQNHYHFVAAAPERAESLREMLQAIHSLTARAINAEDGTAGRKVWYQYRDTCLTNEKSWLARLHYVHTNPVKHGVVKRAEDYAWCSMAWFQREARSGFRRTVLSFPCDQISMDDDF